MIKKLRSGLRIRSQGFGALGWLGIGVITILILAILFYEGRKAYWDHQVRAMCEKDGGVTIYERVTLSDEDYSRLGGVLGGLPIPLREDAEKKQHPYFREIVESRIHESNPEVVRLRTEIRRRSDEKLLGRSVYYFRRGGDVPTGLFHESSYGCPTDDGLSTRIFRLSGATK